MLSKCFKVISLVLVLSMLFAVVGCGAKTASDQPAQKTESTEKAKPADKPAEKVKIKWAVWDYSLTADYKDIIEAFQKENPDITVEPLEMSNKGYDDKLTIMLAGGDETDVIAIKEMPAFSGYVAKKQLMQLDDFIAKDKVDMAPFNGITENIKIDGKLYDFPFRSDFWMLYYNKDIFDKAKVAYPSDDMTFEQFRETAKKLTSGTGKDKTYGTFIHNWKSCIINWPVADKKGTLIDGKYDFIKPAYDIFLPMQKDDKSYMSFAEAKTSSAHYRGQFESGKVGMVIMGSWFVSSLINDKKDGKHNVNWGVTKAPHFNGSKPGTTFGNVTGNAINAKAKNPEAAWKFVKFMGTEAGATIMAKRGSMPAYRTKNVVDAYKGLQGLPEGMDKALETASVALEFPPSKFSAALDKMLQEEHELIMIGKNDPDKGIASMNKRAQEIMAGN
ncbi:MAG: sugar ABC transporter substrate-binding protein [Clostridia bacterium]|nr:sugar ABC transporter substrate-binding protein [Clostridia bacterium]